jgi:hypothetical protein
MSLCYIKIPILYLLFLEYYEYKAGCKMICIILQPVFLYYSFTAMLTYFPGYVLSSALTAITASVADQSVAAALTIGAVMRHI